MNIRLLRKVQLAILKHPDQFDMELWFTDHLEFRGAIVPAGGCGTAGCIAGWAVFCANNFDTMKQAQACNFTQKSPEELLGLEIEQADKLFFRYNWPARFSRAYHAAKRPSTRARIAARRIDHFIKTRGAE